MDCVVVFNCEVVCVVCICKVFGVCIYCKADCVHELCLCQFELVIGVYM